MDSKLAELNDFLLEAPLHQWLGCRITACDEALAAIEVVLPVRRELRTAPDEPTAHGGIVSTLVDIAAHAAVHARTGYGVPTIGLHVDFLRPATMPLTAKAVTRRVGATVGQVDVEVLACDGTLAALGRATFLTRRPKPSPTERQSA